MKKIIEEEITLYEFADRFLNLQDMKTPGNYDVSNLDIEILSFDGEKEVYKPLTNFVVKQSVDKTYVLGDLRGTSEHKILVNGEYKPLKDCENVKILNEKMDVVDVSVDETNCYIANGFINHNTTNGGLALPFHASVRIQLTGGSKVEDKDGNIIGINVIAKTVKNKVAAPHRRAEFKIMFGQGIDETEELFDLLRLAGPKEVEGDLTVEVSGDGAWKTFQVSNTKTGEIIVTKKFNKKDFGDIVKEYKNYMDPLIDAVLVKQLTGTNEELDNDDAEPN